MSGVVVVGVGNAVRGDDGVGLVVAEQLAGRVPPGVRVVQCEQEPTRLLDAWRGTDTAIVVDACASGAEPGSVHRYDASSVGLPAQTFRSSTHAFGVGDAVELGRALGELPQRVIVYGIEGRDFAAGAPVSDVARAAASLVADAIAGELAA